MGVTIVCWLCLLFYMNVKLEIIGIYIISEQEIASSYRIGLNETLLFIFIISFFLFQLLRD